jgi:hypothetical protein
MITDNVLDDITDSKMDDSVSSDSIDCNYSAFASDCRVKHHVFHKPNFSCCCSLTCVNSGSKLLYFCHFKLKFMINQWDC